MAKFGKHLKLNSVCIVTKDVAKLRDFYQNVLDVEASGDDSFTIVLTEDTALTLYNEQGMEQMAPGCMTGTGSGRCVLEFEVDDVDAAYQQLMALNVPIVKPPTTQPWKIRSVWFHDPDGNLINFNAQVP